MVTFYATIDSGSVRPYMPAVPVLLPASSWARRGMKSPRLPEHVTERAADSGGFVATFKWGDYKYTPAEYAAWLHSWQPQWAATMDYCCEPEILGRTGIVRERQERTTMQAWHFWKTYRDAPWAWVPTVQGWEIDDYIHHARALRPLVEEMQAYYGKASAFRVGIGTLCRRASSAMIRAVSCAVAAELPGVPLHLWGVKLAALQSKIGLPSQVISVDSAAWTSDMRYKATRPNPKRDEWKASGKSRAWYEYHVELPRYLAKVRKALSSDKQLPLL